MKTIPAQLLTHKAGETTTLCRLLKVKCKDGTIFGFANLDIDVAYNDNSGDGSITYRSYNGFTPSRISSALGTGVDNSEVDGIYAELSTLGVTEQQVRTGVLDYADAWVYEVNWNDLTAGRHENISRGKLGRTSSQAEAYKNEIRSLTQLLKQQINKFVSLTCRAQYGDTKCGATLVWNSYTITGISGSEPDRIFVASAMAEADDYYLPGVVKITSGDNAGLEVEVETYDAGGLITLALPTYYALAIGITFDIRIDCPKTVDGCKDSRRNRWPNSFRGEHLTPVAREAEILTPGAGL